MEIIRAEYSGYCFGVKRVEEIIEESLKTNDTVYAYGEPIHNGEQIKLWEKRGLVIVHSPDEIPENSVVVIRAHGIKKEEREVLLKKGVKIFDGTCPLVEKVTQKALYLIENGYYVIIAGDKNHPEIIGETSYLPEGSFSIFSGINNDLPPPEIIKTKRKIGVVAQTTFSDKLLSNIISRLAGAEELLLFNTICNETHLRQSSVKELSSNVDLMVVIGGKNSSNTHKLYMLAQEHTKAIQIETENEINLNDIKNAKKIGITAGASTPDWQIINVIDKIKYMLKETENV